MSSCKVLLFDMDNVLNYFDAAVLDYLNSKRREDNQIPQVKVGNMWRQYGQYYNLCKSESEFNQYVRDPMFAEYDFWMSIAPRGDAIRVYKEFRANRRDFRTYILTSAAYIGGYNGKVNWLKQMFGFDEIVDDLIFTSDKSMIRGDYFISVNSPPPTSIDSTNPRFILYDVYEDDGWNVTTPWKTIKEKEGLENGMKRLFPDDCIRFEPVTECARSPRKRYEDDAGFDLFAKEGVDVVMLPFTSKTVETGVRVQLPPNTYGRIAPRSSLSQKGIWINGGVIDKGFSGEIKVLMYNASDAEISIKDGISIAQLIPTLYANVRYSNSYWEKNNQPLGNRGKKGFGSTDD